VARRPKKPEEHENHERWLVSYADFITLLFAFFVVLYGISQVDLEKFKAVSQSLNKSFGGAGNSAIGTMEENETPENWRHAPLVPNAIPDDDTPPITDADRTLFSTIEYDLAKVMQEKKLEGAVFITMEDRGLTIRMGEKRVFEPGSTRLTPEARQLFDRIGKLTRNAPNPIVVEAHVKAAPTADVASLYQLFADRSTVICRMLTQELHIDARRISVAGFGQIQTDAKVGSAAVPDPTPLSITFLPEKARS
jgi:chemotaxis protein MotB